MTLESASWITKNDGNSFPLTRAHLDKIPKVLQDIVIDYAIDLECLSANCYVDPSNADLYKQKVVVALNLEYETLLETVISLFSMLGVTCSHSSDRGKVGWSVKHSTMDKKELEKIRDHLSSISKNSSSPTFFGLINLKSVKLSTFILLSDHVTEILKTVKKSDLLPQSAVDSFSTAYFCSNIVAVMKSPDTFGQMVTPSIEAKIIERINALFGTMNETFFESALWGLSLLEPFMIKFYSGRCDLNIWNLRVVVAKTIYIKWKTVEKVKERVLLKMSSNNSHDKNAKTFLNNMLDISPIARKDIKVLRKELVCLARLFPESKEWFGKVSHFA